MAIGLQDSFSWKGVALSAVSAGVASGVGAAASGWLAGTTMAPTVARAVIANALTQGVAVATGLQDRFSWTNVAAVGIGAGVGNAVAQGLQGTAFATAFGRLGVATASGFAGGLAAAAARGGRISVQQVAVDAFGNAIGNSLVEYDWSGTARESAVGSTGLKGDTFSAYAARQRANNPLLMAMYDRNQLDQLGAGDASYLLPTSGDTNGAGMRDLVYRPEVDSADMTLAGAAAATRRSLFSTAGNAAFRDRVAGIGDQTEIALLQLDRLRQAGVISHAQYADVLNGYEQSREAYGRATWGAVNARVADAIASPDPVIRNSKINPEYFARFSENPDAYWMGLATVASDLVGQGLTVTRAGQQAVNGLPLPQRLIAEVTGLPGDMRTTYAGLSEGNLRVASDMLPIYDVFNNLGGYKGLAAIADVRVNGLTGRPDPVPTTALDGYRLLDEGRQIARGLLPGDAKAKFAESLNALALHEQGDVLQQIYDSTFAGKTLGGAVDNQLRLLGSGNAAIWDRFNPLAPNVLGTYVNPNDVLSGVPLSTRSLGKLDQRMTFVGKIADTFVENLNRMGTSQTLDFLGRLRLAPGTIASAMPRASSV